MNTRSLRGRGSSKRREFAINLNGELGIFQHDLRDVGEERIEVLPRYWREARVSTVVAHVEAVPQPCVLAVDDDGRKQKLEALFLNCVGTSFDDRSLVIEFGYRLAR